MEKIMICKVKDKDGYKYGIDGKCYTYNKNQKSKRKAFDMATSNKINEKAYDK
jgi:hypothetical protein